MSEKNMEEEETGLSAGAKIGVLVAGLILFGGISFAIMFYGLGMFNGKSVEKSNKKLIERYQTSIEEFIEAKDTKGLKKLKAEIKKDKKLKKSEKEELYTFASEKLEESTEEDESGTGAAFAGESLTKELKYVKITINKVTIEEVAGKNVIKISVTLENTGTKPLRLNTTQYWFGSRMSDKQDAFKKDPINYGDAPIEGMAAPDNQFARKETIDDVVIFPYDDEVQDAKSKVFNVRLDLHLLEKANGDFAKKLADSISFFFKPSATE